MIRHSTVKTFEECRVDRAVVYFGVPITINLRGDVTSSYSVAIGLERLGLEDKPLYKLVNSVNSKDYSVVAEEMFSSINKNTGERDVTGKEFYAETIPLGVIGGVITPQVDENGITLFNGNGTVTIAEVLDGLNAIFNGANSDKSRVKSIDNISEVTDYFNEGYNSLCSGYSSPFYNLYERSELFRPITRLELAYLVVVCSDFYGSIFEKYTMGVSFDWTEPSKQVIDFSDWSLYTVSLILTDNRPTADIKAYKKDRSVSELIYDIQSGKSAIPLPMIMSMIELGLSGLFYYEDSNLYPLRQVTRGELCYFLTRLAKGVSINE